MLIKNVKIYTEDKKFVPGEMAVADGRFADPASAAADEVLDGEGCYMIPGLVAGDHDAVRGRTPQHHEDGRGL